MDAYFDESIFQEIVEFADKHGKKWLCENQGAGIWSVSELRGENTFNCCYYRVGQIRLNSKQKPTPRTLEREYLKQNAEQAA